MGLALSRVSFDTWITGYSEVLGERPTALRKQVLGHAGLDTAPAAWRDPIEDYVRIGSYGRYAVFRDALGWAYSGEFEPLDDPDALDKEAREAFSKRVPPKSLPSSAATHILLVGDTDTIFLPKAFEEPLELASEGPWVGSMPRACDALVEFADALGFAIDSNFEEEEEDSRWIPCATARNVARGVYIFFQDASDACVETA